MTCRWRQIIFYMDKSVDSLPQHQPTKHSTIRGRDGAGYKNLSGIFGTGGSESGCLLSAVGRNGTKSIGMSKWARLWSWSHQIQHRETGRLGELSRSIPGMMDGFELQRYRWERAQWWGQLRSFALSNADCRCVIDELLFNSYLRQTYLSWTFTMLFYTYWRETYTFW